MIRARGLNGVRALVNAFLSVAFWRYVVVGLVSNGLLYLAYLGLVAAFLGPKTAASVTYACGVAQTFWFNRAWSFGHQGHAGLALLRYITVYWAGYLLNMLLLYVLVDIYGWDHRWVQAAMVLGLAVLIFLALRFWAFRLESGAS